MLNPLSPLARLMDAPVRPGLVRALLLRPARHAPPLAVAEAQLTPEEGLPGDHHAGRPGSARQVTLMSHEHLAAIGAFLGEGPVAPERLRRNVVVSGLNLLALRGRRLRLGTALLEVTGECHPCSRMERILGPGGYTAVRGHGGVTARVLEAGCVRVGDAAVRE